MAVHSDALLEIFSGTCDPVMTSTVLASKIAVTASILEHYKNSLSTNLQFQAWFASAAQGRLTLHLPQTSPVKVKDTDTVTDGYGTASYFGGSNLVASMQKLTPATAQSLLNIGIKIIPVDEKMSGLIAGDNPIFTIATETNGNIDFNVLDRFLIPEENIVIYDKYINKKSIELLEHISKKLAPNSTLSIFHTFQINKNLLDSAEIINRLKTANPNISVICKKCSKKFTSLEHDRYIFLGNRIQIVFSAGLDCFGNIDLTIGKRVNRRSKITFYDVTAGDLLHIEADDLSIFIVNSISSL